MFGLSGWACYFLAMTVIAIYLVVYYLANPLLKGIKAIIIRVSNAIKERGFFKFLLIYIPSRLIVILIRVFASPLYLFLYGLVVMYGKETRKEFFKGVRTPTEGFVKIIQRIVLGIGLSIAWLFFVGLIYASYKYILPHLLSFFNEDQTKAGWIWFFKGFWWIWFFIRGTIFFTFIGMAWKQLKKFPKIIYFKDLVFIFSRSFLLIYLLVLIFTIVEVLKAIVLGQISTPLYLYYVNWYHLIFM